MSDTDRLSEDEEIPLSPGSVELILSNLFRREDGEPMDFYVRKSRFQHHPKKEELHVLERLYKLKEVIDKCGGILDKGPISNYAIELGFPELFDEDPTDCDVFKVDFISECVSQLELLNLEDFRIGKSPYDGSVNITDILKGLKTWDSVNRRAIASPPKGRKLPDFATEINPGHLSDRSPPPRKKQRHEYTIKEDTAILKFVLKKNLYDQVGGNTTWKIVAREFPHHSYQSLQNHFRKFIMPNLDKYTGLTASERNLFCHGVSLNGTSSDSCKPSSDKAASPEIAQEEGEEEKENEPSESNSKIIPESPKIVSQCNDIMEDDPDPKANPDPPSELDEIFPEEELPISKRLKSKSVSNVNLNGSDFNTRVLIEETQSSNCSEKSEIQTLKPDSSSDSSESPANEFKKPKFHSQFKANKENDSSSSSSSSSESSTDSVRESRARKRKSCQSSHGKCYSLQEDRLILDYIIKKKRFSEVRGKVLWVDIEKKVLHEYHRTWESAKNRFSRTIMKDLHKYKLDDEIIDKFQEGMIVERNLGGARRVSKKSSSKSRCKTAVHHPALQDSPPRKETVMKAPRNSPKQVVMKRKLFRQPTVPLPVLFSPHPRVASAKNSVKLSGVNIRPEIESARKDIARQSQLPLAAPESPPVEKLPECRIVLKRLTQEELDQYCGKSASAVLPVIDKQLQTSITGEPVSGKITRSSSCCRVRSSPRLIVPPPSKCSSLMSSGTNCNESKSTLVEMNPSGTVPDSIVKSPTADVISEEDREVQVFFELFHAVKTEVHLSPSADTGSDLFCTPTDELFLDCQEG